MLKINFMKKINTICKQVLKLTDADFAESLYLHQNVMKKIN